jgi:hypothetical protein
MPGSAEVTTYAGMIAPGDPGEWTLQIMPSLAASGSYLITVTGQDSMSGKSHSLTASVNVTPCQYVECGANSCGQIASNNGCGGTSPVVCASCQSGYFCSANQCCPNGTAWNAAEGACETVCPSGESVCPATGTPACKVQTGGGCRKIGSIVECN